MLEVVCSPLLGTRRLTLYSSHSYRDTDTITREIIYFLQSIQVPGVTRVQLPATLPYTLARNCLGRYLSFALVNMWPCGLVPTEKRSKSLSLRLDKNIALFPHTVRPAGEVPALPTTRAVNEPSRSARRRPCPC